ncbi:unnamed protein product, partial [Nesidiocoris tenuis]
CFNHRSTLRLFVQVDYDTKTQRFLLNSKFDDGFPVGGIRPLEALLLRIDAPYVHRHEVIAKRLLDNGNSFSKQTSKKHGTTSPSKDGKRSSKSPARKSRVESLTRNASLGKSAARKSNASKKGRKKSRTGSKASNASLRKSMARKNFFNRGDKWRQYGIDRFGNVYRIPRAGQEGWESADILEDGLVKKHGSHKNGSGSRTETRRKGQIADAESRLQRSEHHSKRSGESKRQSLRKHSRRDEPTRHEPTRHESHADSKLGRSGQFSRRSIDSVKGRGNRKRGRGSGQLGTASRKRKGKTQKEQDL